MRNEHYPDRERVRIDFSRQLLNEASRKAQLEGRSLSEYVEEVVNADLASRHGGYGHGRL